MNANPMRADPGADLDLSDFKPAAKRPTVERQTIREVSEAVGFPSRAPGQAKPAANVEGGRAATSSSTSR